MNKDSNKFNFLRDRKGATQESPHETESAAPMPAPAPPQVEAIQPMTEQPKKMGRPRGKRSDPNFEQVTAYIRRDTYTAIKIALLQENQGREFSELIEQLLNEYLSTQKSKNLKT